MGAVSRDGQREGAGIPQRKDLPVRSDPPRTGTLLDRVLPENRRPVPDLSPPSRGAPRPDAPSAPWTGWTRNPEEEHSGQKRLEVPPLVRGGPRHSPRWSYSTSLSLRTSFCVFVSSRFVLSCVVSSLYLGRGVDDQGSV